MDSQSSTEMEVLFTTEDAAPLPKGAPPDLRERLALALKTTSADTLDAAERDFRGVYLSVRDFLEDQIGRDLPPHLGWLLACCADEALLEGFERGRLTVWTVPFGDRVLVFESARASARRARA